jgi:hypothetical protein
MAAKQRSELIASVIRRSPCAQNVTGSIFWRSTTCFRGVLISNIENSDF